MNDKEKALHIIIMICSSLQWIDKPSSAVKSASNTIMDNLKNEFLKPTGKFEVRKIGQKIFKFPTRVADQYYIEINEKVIEAWKQARHKYISKDGELPILMSELVQVLWDRLNRNKYQSRWIGIKKMEKCIESLANSDKSEKYLSFTDEEATKNSRVLAEEFLSILGIEKEHLLARRVKILKGNLIMDGRL